MWALETQVSWTWMETKLARHATTLPFLCGCQKHFNCLKAQIVPRFIVFLPETKTEKVGCNIPVLWWKQKCKIKISTSKITAFIFFGAGILTMARVEVHELYFAPNRVVMLSKQGRQPPNQCTDKFPRLHPTTTIPTTANHQNRELVLLVYRGMPEHTWDFPVIAEQSTGRELQRAICSEIEKPCSTVYRGLVRIFRGVHVHVLLINKNYSYRICRLYFPFNGI